MHTTDEIREVTEHCPVCDSTEIEINDHDYNIKEIEINYYCRTCHSLWDIYARIKPYSWELVKDGKEEEAKN